MATPVRTQRGRGRGRRSGVEVAAGAGQGTEGEVVGVVGVRRGRWSEKNEEVMRKSLAVTYLNTTKCTHD